MQTGGHKLENKVWVQNGNLCIHAYGNAQSMPIDEAAEIIEQFTERVYIDRFRTHFARTLEKAVGHQQFGITDRSRFMSMLSPRKTQINLSFSGQTRSNAVNILTRQRELINHVVTELKDILGALIHGATMWSFIKDVHKAALENNLLSVGVMPWIGLWDLKKIRDELGNDFPKMHFLGIEGIDYTEHAKLFSSLPTNPEKGAAIIIGGRDGAYAEAEASRINGKFVVAHPVEEGSDAVSGVINKGVLSITNHNMLTDFLKSNLTPGQKLFRGIMPELEAFYQYLETNKIINMGFVSTSGSFTNYPYVRDILHNFLSWGIPTELYSRTEVTGGGTRYGGIWEMNDVAQKIKIRRNGLMCAKGVHMPWADADQMVYVGKDWGDESKHFLNSSNLLIAFIGGGQAKFEIISAAKSGGKNKHGIPVIVLHDEYTGGATHALYTEGFTHPNVHFFHTSQLQDAASFLRKTLTELAKTI